MIYVLIKDGMVEHCVSVDSITDLTDYYPEHLILGQVGEENVGWSFDGSVFAPPRE